MQYKDFLVITQKSSTRIEQDNMACSFNRLMEEGRVKTAFRRVSNQQMGSLLSLDTFIPNKNGTNETLRQVLQSKYAPTTKTYHSVRITIAQVIYTRSTPNNLDCLDASLIS